MTNGFRANASGHVLVLLDSVNDWLRRLVGIGSEQCRGQI